MHLTENEIALYIEDRLSPDAREKVEGHLADCSLCVEQVAALARLDEMLAGTADPALDTNVVRKAEEIVGEPFRQPTAKMTSFWSPVRYAIAAVLVVSVGIAYYFTTTPIETERFRSDAHVPSSFILSPEDGATIPQEGLRFSWTAIPSAITYRLTLHELDGEVVWTIATKETSLTVAPTVALQTGNKYLWRVEALFPDDTRFRSQLNAITVSP
ncbi:MAG: hypothetical protein AAB393_04680 [Bacteroidota bacterium]